MLQTVRLFVRFTNASIAKQQQLSRHRRRFRSIRQMATLSMLRRAGVGGSISFRHTILFEYEKRTRQRKCT